MAEATIDELQIEIESDSADASQALEKLQQTLERLVAPVQSLTTGNGLNKLTKQLQKLAEAGRTISSLSGLDKITQTANALKSLDTLTGVPKIGSYISALNKLSQASGAVQAIAAFPDVTAQLTALSGALSALGGLNGAAPDVGGYVKALNKLSQAGTAIQTIAGFPDITAQLTALTNALNSMRNIQDIRLTPLINSLERLPAVVQAINSMPAIDTSRIEMLNTAMAAFRTENTQAIRQLANALNKLPAVAQRINQIDFTQFSNSIRQLTTTLEPLMQRAEQAAQGLTALAQVMQAASRQSSNSNGLGGLGRTLGTLSTKSLLSWASLLKLKNVLGDCFNISAQYVENLNLFNVTMGKSASSAFEFAEAVNAALGVDTSDWIRYQGFFQSVGKGFGVVSDKADLMSKNLTQLAYDISSFYNISTEEAYNKVQSGFAGELEPLRRLGFALDEATLKQLAYKKGITQTYESMTQAQKAQLRYVAMIEQAKNIGVTGDMSRTIDTASNGVRVLEARIQQFTRAIGNMLMPMLSAILPYLTAFVQVLTEGANAIANLFGFELPKIDLSGVSNGYDDITEAADGATAATEKFKGSLAGVDQLNIIGSRTDKSGSGTGYSTDLDIELPTYDFLNGVESKTKEIAENIKNWFKEALPWIEAVGTVIASAFLGTKIAGFVNELGKVKAAFKALKDMKLAGLAKGLAGFVGGLAAGASSGVLLYNSIKNLIKGTGDLTNNVTQLAVGIVIAGGAMAAFVALGNPVGAVITAIGALAGAVLGVASAIHEADCELARIQQDIADTNVYMDNGGISVTALSDGFTNYFDNISGHYDDILENTRAFEDNKEKVNGAAKEIHDLTGKYTALGNAITTEDAQKISDNLSIIEKGVSENLGLATQNIIDTLKGKFSELASKMCSDIDSMMSKFRILESMGNTALADLRKEADELTAKIAFGDYTSEDLVKLDEVVRKMTIVDTGTTEQKSFEQALLSMTSADINFESPQELTNALETVQSAAEKAKNSISEAWASQTKQLDDLEATFRNQGTDKKYDAEFGTGKFDELFETYRKIMDTGYKQDLSKIDNSVGIYTAMLYSKLNDHVNSAVYYATPTYAEQNEGAWDEWCERGLLMSGESAYLRAKGKAEQRVRSGFDDVFGAIFNFADEYKINLSDYEGISNQILQKMKDGTYSSSNDFYDDLDKAAASNVETTNFATVTREWGNQGPAVGYAREAMFSAYSEAATQRNEETSPIENNVYVSVELDGEEVGIASRRVQARQEAMANGR